jgi:magnesium transporter
MQQFEKKVGSLDWIDIVAPSKAALEKLSLENGLPLKSVLACLDPEHLPKYQIFENSVFVILRVMDQNISPQADSIETLTTKVAIFISSNKVVTIHRLDLDFIRELRERSTSCNFKDLILALVEGSVNSYEEPLSELEKSASLFEERVFKYESSGDLVEEGFYLKRRASAARKVLKFTLDVIGKLIARPDFDDKDFVLAKEQADRLLFYTDEVIENVTSLLNLKVSLAAQRTNEASYKTNEIVRVLTVFSIFFLPLNFIAGVYGMNFDNMPELKWSYGYFFALLAMASVATAIYLWLKRRDWI